MRRRPTRRPGAAPVLLATLAAVVLTACSPASEGASDPGGGEVDQAAVDRAEAALAEVTGQVLSTGPNGEQPASAEDVQLTDEQVAQVQALGATAAIVMHYSGDDWSVAQIDGLRSEFERLGIEVIATTDADFDPAQQVSDVETVMAQQPDIIVSIPTDPIATAGAYRAAAQAGTKLVFMDNVPEGFVAGQDYVSAVSADNFGNGVISAHLMARALGGSGQIGLIYHEADFFVTKQRFDGFKQTIQEDYPDVEIVAEQGIAGPDFAGDAQAVANAMLSQNPDLDGIWAVWDVPAEGVMAAARAAGRTDLKIATEDLGLNVALALARDQLVVGLGAQRPYDQGVTEARLAALSLLGAQTPPYVALPALPVDHDNVLEAWQEVYRQDPPADLTDSFAD
ncbi:substrate-binding domain-containing protein [Geodermatophilus ruber]|uniref:Monosaccharide ABC transporter substrate-binding protein, CUT2 family n=1 Tax=Geodermatophilus ruber TaxID=504800 RepID=A0A1I3ZAR7_9ACTN|nr:substrate-binding domain-containing protein [Geodermatophilus ruber]SFK40736.1 monosaccharide ABC transporter substrate-binding protein, CUT2 family [Geodermatophilus ruber]